MSDISLTQAEAEALIAMEKHRVDKQRHDFPMPGGFITIPLQSPDNREQFLLDISRGRIDLLKGKYQNRARRITILVRLDFGGRPHRNPDDEEIPCPHLHVYREGYGTKWAYPAPADKFADTANFVQTLEEFMQYCNITQPPIIEKGLL